METMNVSDSHKDELIDKEQLKQSIKASLATQFDPDDTRDYAFLKWLNKYTFGMISGNKKIDQ